MCVCVSVCVCVCVCECAKKEEKESVCEEEEGGKEVRKLQRGRKKDNV